MIKKHVGMDALAMDQHGNIYISDIFQNGLYKYSSGNEELQFLAVFPDAGINEKNLHSDAVYIKENIYFLCYNRPVIHVYSCTDSEIREIRFEEDRGHNLRLILREDTLFILSDSGNIREYNINSNTIAACSKNYASELRNYIDKFKTGSNCTKYQRGFILCENGGNCFVKVDVINETSRMYAAPCDDLRMVYLFAGRYWFLKNHSFNAAAWDGRSTCVKEYQCVHNEWINRNHFFPYADMVNSGGDLYIVNHYAALAMKVNEKTSSLIPAYGQESRQCPANDNPYGGLYGRCAEYGDCLYFFPCQSRDIVRISKKDGQIKYVLSYADINKDYMKQIDIMFEGDILVDEEVTVADWPLRCLVREQTPDETLL